MNSLVRSNKDVLNALQFEDEVLFMINIFVEFSKIQEVDQHRRRLSAEFQKSNPVQVLQRLSAWRTAGDIDFKGPSHLAKIYSYFLQCIHNLTVDGKEFRTYFLSEGGIELCLNELTELIYQTESAAPAVLHETVSDLYMILFNVACDFENVIQMTMKFHSKIINLLDKTFEFGYLLCWFNNLFERPTDQPSDSVGKLEDEVDRTEIEMDKSGLQIYNFIS